MTEEKIMPRNREVHILDISSVTMVRFFGIVLGLFALYFISDVLFALIFAIIVASAIEPAIEWMKEHRIPRILGAILIYLLIAGCIAFVVYLIFPLLSEEIQTISSTIPSFQDSFTTGLTRLGLVPFAPFLSDNLDLLFQAPAEYLGKLSGGVVNFASAVFGGILSFILVVVFSFYLVVQEKGIESFLRLVTPLRHEPYIVHVWHRAQRKLGRWFRAQILLGAIVGFFIFFGLTLLHVKYALLFALITALFEIIPVVGPVLAAVLPVLTTFASSPLLGVSVIILYVVVQQIESHIIVPVVMRKTIGLNPLIVVLALLVGGKLGGIFGVLLSVPVAAILVEFLEDWDKKKRAVVEE